MNDCAPQGPHPQQKGHLQQFFLDMLPNIAKNDLSKQKITNLDAMIDH